MRRVNILTRYKFPIFVQHFDSENSERKTEFYENSLADIDWDCVVVFDGLKLPAQIRVKRGGLLFVAGEPPDAMYYTKQFLDQFDRTYCAHSSARRRIQNKSDQYFNNWHFGYEPNDKVFRYNFSYLRKLPPPPKNKNISVITSNLSYMPNHIKRLHLIEALRRKFAGQIEFFGRGHNFVQYKEDAILPFRFHLCLENTITPDLWTEKIADPFLGYSVPVYSGSPNISEYFPPNSIIQINVDDIAGTLKIIEDILKSPKATYENMLPDVIMARTKVLEDYNLTAHLAKFLDEIYVSTEISVSEERTILPNENTKFFETNNLALRAKRFAYRKYSLMRSHRNPVCPLQSNTTKAK
ncbi:MAG: glycosyltransferase family 10 [Patescibacteria group bacterium]